MSFPPAEVTKANNCFDRISLFRFFDDISGNFEYDNLTYRCN